MQDGRIRKESRKRLESTAQANSCGCGGLQPYELAVHSIQQNPCRKTSMAVRSHDGRKTKPNKICQIGIQPRFNPLVAYTDACSCVTLLSVVSSIEHNPQRKGPLGRGPFLILSSELRFSCSPSVKDRNMNDFSIIPRHQVSGRTTDASSVSATFFWLGPASKPDTASLTISGDATLPSPWFNCFFAEELSFSPFTTARTS